MTEKEDPKIDEKKEVGKKIVVGLEIEEIVIGAIVIGAIVIGAIVTEAIVIEAIETVAMMDAVSQKRN